MRPEFDNTLRLGIKELRSLRADPILLLLIVYIFTFAIYAVTTGITFEVEHAAVGIVDEDHSELSRRKKERAGPTRGLGGAKCVRMGAGTTTACVRY